MAGDRPKVWSISTTVRNPERTRGFLRVLKELEGQDWDSEIQQEFQIRLIARREYKPTRRSLTPAQIKLLDQPDPISLTKAREIFLAKGYEDPAMRGRNSLAPLRKIGWADIVDGVVTITRAGEQLLQPDADLGDSLLRSLLKWQCPNPLSRSFGGDNYDIKPFVGTLHLIREVNQLAKSKKLTVKGISRMEFLIFGLSLLDCSRVHDQATALIDFRQRFEAKSSRKKKQAFFERFVKNWFSSFAKTSQRMENLRDYADNAIRYFRLTRWLTLRGGGYYLDLEPRRRVEIDSLLKVDDGSSDDLSLRQYTSLLGDPARPEMPWETPSALKKIHGQVSSDILKLERDLGRAPKPVAAPKGKAALKAAITKLRNRRRKLQDESLAREFAPVERIKEAIAKLENIRSEPSPPLALEKWATVALNILNDAEEIRPNYPVDDENEPTFTAPGNKPDIECFYSSFSAICEVTLLTGRNQWYAEGQPVMRHLRDFEERADTADEAFGLFVAQAIHRDTRNTFWTAVRHDYEGERQRIVPLTIGQLVDLLRVVLALREADKQLSHKQLRTLFRDICQIDQLDSSQAWSGHVSETLSAWSETVCRPC